MEKNSLTTQSNNRDLSTSLSSQSSSKGGGYALSKFNLILLTIGFAIIIFGLVLMVGGGSEGKEFNPEIFSARRVTIGPMIALFGFVFEIAAILWKPKH